MPARHLPRRAIELSLALALGVGSAFLASRLIAPNMSAREADYQSKTAQRSQQGEFADEPYQIPSRGWFDIIRRTYHEVDRDRVTAVAAGVTFYALLAVFPALTAFVSLYGLVADPATISDQLAMLEGLLPGGATDFLRDQIVRISSGGESTLGVALAVSVGAAIWSANAGVKAIFDALNVAYGEDEKRGFFRLNLVSLAFTSGMLLFILAALGTITVIPIILDYVYLGNAAETLIIIGRWPILIAVLMMGLSLLYRYGPSRDAAQWSWVSPGAVFSSIAWLITSLLFSWYVANFEDYNRTYGAIGALIGLLMWMWLSATIVLIGAELNSEAERQTDKDTTRGPPMPIGLRGADAADRKG